MRLSHRSYGVEVEDAGLGHPVIEVERNLCGYGADGSRGRRSPFSTQRATGRRASPLEVWTVHPIGAGEASKRGANRGAARLYEQPLVVPQLLQTKQAPALCMTIPHW